MDGSAGRWVDASMECWVDAGAWWMVAWQMGDVLATSQYRPIHADHQTMFRKHSLMDRRHVQGYFYPFTWSP